MKPPYLFLLASILVTPLHALAQDEAKPAKEEKPAKKNDEKKEKEKESARDKWLSRLTGNWKIEWEQLGEKKSKKLRGVEAVHWSEGQWLRTHFCSNDGATEYLGFTRVLENGEDYEAWSFSNAGQVMHYGGHREGDEFTWTLETDEGEMRFRASIKEEGPLEGTGELRAKGSSEWKLVEKGKSTKVEEEGAACPVEASMNLDPSTSAAKALPDPIDDNVLDKLVGTWDVTAKMADGKVVKSTEEFAWKLNRQFLVSTTRDEKDGKVEESYSLWTRGEEPGTYRGYTFEPTGDPSMSTARLDEGVVTVQGTMHGSPFRGVFYPPRPIDFHGVLYDGREGQENVKLGELKYVRRAPAK